MAVVEEARAIGRGLANRWLWLFMMVAAFTVTASYQVKQPTVLDIGGPNDCPWLGTSEYCLQVPPQSPGWNDSETDPTTGATYRWTKAQSEILLPGLGNQPYNVTLRWAGQPISQTTPVTITINAQEFHWALSAVYQEKTFFVSRFGLSNADVRVTIVSPPFKPANDARRLGVRVDWVKVEPADYGVGTLVIPATGVTISLLVALLIIYLIARRILLQPGIADGREGGLPPAPTHFALIAPAIGLLQMLAALLFSRLNLTGFAPQLAVTLLWALLFFMLVLIFIKPTPTYPYSLITKQGERHTPPPALPQRGRSNDAPSPSLPLWGVGQPIALLAGIFALAFAVRFGGMVHPQFITSDLTFHAHRIDFMLQFFSGQQKNFFFDGQLPNGTHVPYPSAYYLLLAPLEWLFGGSTEAGMLLLRFFSTLLDASVTLLLYRIVARFGSLAALGAAFLYAVSPALFQLFSAGNHSNIFAQTMFVASLLFAVEALNADQNRPPRPYSFYLLFSTLTMLGHYGMFIAAVGVTVTIGVVWLIFAPRALRNRIWPLLGAFAAALLISYLLYYIHFNAQIGGQISGLLNGSGGRGNGFAPFALLGDILKWQGWVIIPMALVGIVLLWRRGADGNSENTPTRLLIAGWLLACIPLAATALFDRDTIRYNYLALPALCICGGLAMQWLAAWPAAISLNGRRYRAGVALVGLVVMVAIVNIALIWGELIFHQYH